MNLLTDPLFRVRCSNVLQVFNLPELLAALGRDEVVSLPGLQRHQEDAFHIFLCYLAAGVLSRQQREEPQQDEAFWREGIRQLTGREDDAAWTLVVEDVTKPAFMQPALASRAEVKSLKLNATTADALDLLPTAKNHDIKTARSQADQLETWCYALISLQTMSGFFGRGNYGIARMNGGFASRPCVELQLDRSPAGRWQRAVRRLLVLRPKLLQSPWPYQADGLMLLWNRLWNGEQSLALTALDPFFIEISRVVRLAEQEGGIVALTKPSKVSCIEAKAQLGVLGDPWIPLNAGKKELTALTVSPAGLTPELLQKLLFGEGISTAWMQKPAADEVGRAAHLYVSVLVRGQGTTDGFHSVVIPIPTKAGVVLFAAGAARDQLGELSKKALEQARNIQNRVLKVALFSLLEAGPEQVNFDKREVAAWVDRAVEHYSRAWSNDYFEWLWQSLDHDDKDYAEQLWLDSLYQKALNTLEEAIARLPQRRGRSYRAEVKARDLFFGSLYKQFPQLKEYHHEQRRA